MDVLINWLWQASAFVVIVGLAVAPWRGMSAAMRYAIWSIALTLVVVMPFRAWFEPEPPFWLPAATGAAASAAAPFTLPSLPAFPLWVTIAAICLWIEWVAFSAVRLARAAGSLAEARRACQPFPADRAARLPLWQCFSRDGRSATLALSPRVSGAAVLGLRRPIIAISPALARRLSDEELDQVIVHELAHVRRHDDVAALLLALVDVVAGFHPAVRVAQVRLRLEREMACDDWVVRATGSAKRYAACLTRVASVQQPGGELLAPGALAPAQLTLRVTRLLDRRRSRARASRSGMVLAAAPLVVLAIAVEALALEAARPHAVRTTTAAWSAVASDASLADAVAVRAIATEGRARRRVPLEARVDGSTSTASIVQVAARRPASVALPAQSSPRTDAVRPASAEPMPDVIDAPAPLVLDGYRTAVVAESTIEEESGGPPLSTLPWRAPATAGVAIGQGSASAGLAVAQGAADAGVAIGKGSQKAATATAGFVSRMGKSLVRVF